MRQIIIIFLSASCFFLLPGMSLFSGKYYLSSFEGKVIDVETKEPIEGAAVLAVYYKKTYSPAGSNSYAIDAQETLTNPDGQFKIPSKSGKSDDYSGKLECNLIIFKPEYGVFPRHKLSNAVGVNKSWPPPEKYIVYELPKLKTKEERRKNMFFDYYNGFPYAKSGRFIDIVNEERNNLGLPLVSTARKEDKK